MSCSSTLMENLNFFLNRCYLLLNKQHCINNNTIFWIKHTEQLHDPPTYINNELTTKHNRHTKIYVSKRLAWKINKSHKIICNYVHMRKYLIEDIIKISLLERSSEVIRGTLSSEWEKSSLNQVHNIPSIPQEEEYAPVVRKNTHPCFQINTWLVWLSGDFQSLNFSLLSISLKFCNFDGQNDFVSWPIFQVGGMESISW